MAESLFRHIPNNLLLFPVCVGAPSCALQQHLHNSCPPEVGVTAIAVSLGRGNLSPLGQGCLPFPGEEISLVSNANTNPPPRLLPLSCHLLLLQLKQRLMHRCVKEPLLLCLLPMGDGVSRAQQLLDMVP